MRPVGGFRQFGTPTRSNAPDWAPGSFSPSQVPKSAELPSCYLLLMLGAGRVALPNSEDPSHQELHSFDTAPAFASSYA